MLHRTMAPADFADGLLERTDAFSSNNRRTEAKFIYAKAALFFTAQDRPGKAQYATVNEIPADA